MNHSRYARFPDEVCHWENLPSFLSSSDWKDAIHVIGLRDGSSLDVLIRGGIQNYDASLVLPVFFNGAVDRSKGQPPFFSGSTLAKELATPFIAIADPTLRPENKLGIGWYTGLPGSESQESIAKLLTELSMHRPIVLVGGSAGGFASLHFASQVEVPAFVWNPQTDILQYGSAFVRPYLSTMLNDPSWESLVAERLRDTPPINYSMASSALDGLGIRYEIQSVQKIPRLLYLQNSTDKHAKRDAEPLRQRDRFRDLGRGLFASEGRIMAVGNFAPFHKSPPRETISCGLQAVGDPTIDLTVYARRILDTAAEKADT